jgi:hypothetical protein
MGFGIGNDWLYFSIFWRSWQDLVPVAGEQLSVAVFGQFQGRRKTCPHWVFARHSRCHPREGGEGANPEPCTTASPCGRGTPRPPPPRGQAYETIYVFGGGQTAMADYLETGDTETCQG